MTSKEINEVKNRNLLSPVGFQFVIDRLPNVEYFTQKITLPGIFSTPISSPNPNVKIKYQGDSLNFEEFSVEFKVDEDLQNWLEIKNWMFGYTFPEKQQQFSNLKQGLNLPANLKSNLLIPPKEGFLYSDASIVILTNKHNANFRFDFKDAFPVALSNIPMDVTNTGIDHVTATATFSYTRFDVEKIT